MLAHLLLMPTPVALIDDLINQYQSQLSINERLVEQFIGMEIIRRLIGLAQLPLVLDLDRKSQLLESASALLLGKITLPVFLLNLS
jgi:5-methylthioribose kinase